MWLYRPFGIALACLACSAPSFQADSADSGGSSGGTGGGKTDSGAVGGVGGAAGNSGAAGTEASVCADTQCEDVRCANIPLITHPWQGPLRVLAPGQTDCPSTYPDRVAEVGTLDVPQGTCPKCSCSAGAKVTCAKPNIDVYSSTDCSGSPLGSKSSAPACVFFSFSGSGPQSFGYKKPAPGGSCDSSDDGQTPNIPSADLGGVRALCRGVAGTGVGTCALAGSEPVCVASPLLDTCPQGYPKKATYSQGPVSDPRGCSPCGCGPVQGSCDGTVVVRHYSTTCAAGGASATDSKGGCSGPQTGSLTQYFSLHTAPKPKAECTPTGGVVTGTPTAAQTWTVCCTS